MSFAYKCVLLIGATSGIGAAMADRLVEEGVKVIAVGRRQDRLDQFVTKHGKDKAGAIQFDITNTAGLDGFVEKVAQTSPDLDCIFLNAGMQKPHNFLDPQFSLEEYHGEFNVNYTSLVNLTMKFLPILMKQGMDTGIIVTGTNVAVIPIAGCPGYSGSKAALNVFVLCLREQLRDTRVRVIEISPPPVQTEIHDYLGKERGRAFGMPVDQYTKIALDGIKSGSDQVITGAPPGGSEEDYHRVVEMRRKHFEGLAAFTRKMASQ